MKKEKASALLGPGIRKLFGACVPRTVAQEMSVIFAGALLISGGVWSPFLWQARLMAVIGAGWFAIVLAYCAFTKPYAVAQASAVRPMRPMRFRDAWASTPLSEKIPYFVAAGLFGAAGVTVLFVDTEVIRSVGLTFLLVAGILGALPICWALDMKWSENRQYDAIVGAWVRFRLGTAETLPTAENKDLLRNWATDVLLYFATRAQVAFAALGVREEALRVFESNASITGVTPFVPSNEYTTLKLCHDLAVAIAKTCKDEYFEVWNLFKELDVRPLFSAGNDSEDAKKFLGRPLTDGKMVFQSSIEGELGTRLATDNCATAIFNAKLVRHRTNYEVTDLFVGGEVYRSPE